MDFFSLVLCALLLVTVLFLFQKAAINNTLISKVFYVILCSEINKCIITVIIHIIVPTKSIIVASLVCIR